MRVVRQMILSVVGLRRLLIDRVTRRIGTLVLRRLLRCLVVMLLVHNARGSRVL